jgi:hypothetical protein
LPDIIDKVLAGEQYLGREEGIPSKGLATDYLATLSKTLLFSLTCSIAPRAIFCTYDNFGWVTILASLAFAFFLIFSLFLSSVSARVPRLPLYIVFV